MIPTIVGVVTLVFFLLHLIPGDPIRIWLGPDPQKQAHAELLIKKFGLDQPLHVQYGRYLKQLFLHLDMGVSIIEKEPVTRLIISRWPVTISFSLLSLLFAVGLAIPIGVYSAIHRNRPFDHLGRVFALLGVSMPNFWVGLMLIILFAHRWHLLPSGGYVPINESFVGWLKSMVLPVVTLGTGQTALTMRMMRSCMLEVLHQDYVTTARAHGAPEWKVTWVHAFRNAFIPVLTVLGMNISLLLSGATVTEVVFALPGNGRLAYQALLNRDYPTLMGSTIIFALMYITSTFLVDIAYAFIDPRIKYE